MTFTYTNGHLNHRRKNCLAIYRQEGRCKRPKWQFPDRKRKSILWGLGRDSKRERNTCVSEEPSRRDSFLETLPRLIKKETGPELASHWG